MYADMKAELRLHVSAGGAEQHSRGREQELDAAAPVHQQVCQVSGRFIL